MNDIERMLGEQGRANRWLGEEILQQGYLETMNPAASQPRPSMNVYGSTCPSCCGDVDDAALLKSGVAACQFCLNKEPAAEQTRSRWISPSHDMQIQTSAGIALPQKDNG